MASSTVVQDISDQITCSICLDHFKIPKTVIPCLHNFCKGCLQCTIESTATAKRKPQHDPQITSILTFPCPQCRGPVEFPVRIPRPWKMKQIAIESAEKEFKTNFQIQHQLEIIKKRIENGCPQHEGELRIWYCNLCRLIICQFCMQESHDPAEHGVTPLSKVATKRRQEISVRKETLKNSILRFKQKSAEIQSHLESIFNVRSKFDEQQQMCMTEIQKAKVEILSLETAFLTQGDSFSEQLTSNETFSLEIFQHVSDKLERCKTVACKLQKALSGTDLDVLEQASDVDTEKIEADTLLEFTIANLPEPPKMPIEQVKQGVQRVMNIVSDLRISISSNTGADYVVLNSTEDRLLDQEPSENTPIVTANKEKKQETKEKVTAAVEKANQMYTVPEKLPVKEENQPELTESEQKEESKPDVESEKLSLALLPDQWSPLNPEGKKHYGRDFLLQFQHECKDRPDGLPHIPDIVLDKADIRPIAGVAEPRLTTPGGGGARSRGGDGGADFMPTYMRSPRGNQPPPQFPMLGGGGGGKRAFEREPKDIQKNEKCPEPTLKKSENAWKPCSKRVAEKPKTNEQAKTASGNNNVQLGGRPGAFGSWGRGNSSGGAKTQSSEQVDFRPAGKNKERESRPCLAPPTRDSKGGPIGNMLVTRSRERDERSGASREGSQKRTEKRQLLDEVSSTISSSSSSSMEKDRRSNRDRESERGSRECRSSIERDRDSERSNRESHGNIERDSRDRDSERGNREGRGNIERDSRDRDSERGSRECRSSIERDSRDRDSERSNRESHGNIERDSRDRDSERGSREGRGNIERDSRDRDSERGSRERRGNIERDSRDMDSERGSREGRGYIERGSRDRDSERGSREGRGNIERDSRDRDSERGSREGRGYIERDSRDRDSERGSREGRGYIERDSTDRDSERGSREGRGNVERDSRDRDSELGNREGRGNIERDSRDRDSERGSREGRGNIERDSRDRDSERGSRDGRGNIERDSRDRDSERGSRERRGNIERDSRDRDSERGSRD